MLLCIAVQPLAEVLVGVGRPGHLPSVDRGGIVLTGGGVAKHHGATDAAAAAGHHCDSPAEVEKLSWMFGSTHRTIMVEWAGRQSLLPPADGPRHPVRLLRSWTVSAGGGGAIGATPLKITDYHKPANAYLGYGGGYGGL